MKRIKIPTAHVFKPTMALAVPRCYRKLKYGKILRVCGEELPNCKVASGYIQAYLIAEKVIKEKRDNKFLGVGRSIHTNVRTDFYETDNGLARKDKEKINAPGM
jgi:hypothetical protein